MKKTLMLVGALAAALVTDFAAVSVTAQSVPAPVPYPWHYTLLPDSRLIDDCPVCVRPSIPRPLRGTFELRWVRDDLLFTTYAVEQVSLTSERPGAESLRMTGKGTYIVGGEVALRHELFLELTIDDGSTVRRGEFINATPTPGRLWPMIGVSATQTNGTITQVYNLDLIAAPFQELWFSTRHGFHPAISGAGDQFVSGGDLLAETGRVVRRNQELTGRLGIMPVVPDLGLDAVDVLPGGEVGFSIEGDVFSESLGALHHGDLLSANGRVLRGYNELIGSFTPEPPAPDVGLDAVQVLEKGEVLFSIESDIFSEKLGVQLHRGDLLSSRGLVVRGHQELLSRFHPADTKRDYGLDAVFVWPSGEIWFSTEDRFEDRELGVVLDGDLLSDQGHVVYRNRDFLSRFGPLEDLADFGLDGLFVVTDLLPAAAPARCVVCKLAQPGPGLQLQWESAARVFQLEKAARVTGPYLPFGLIAPDLEFLDPEAPRGALQSYYRLRQW
jgi:hypothetical protein